MIRSMLYQGYRYYYVLLYFKNEEITKPQSESISECFVLYRYNKYVTFSCQISVFVILMLMPSIFKLPDEIPNNLTESFFDAIVVLGGGVPLSPNDPPLYVQERCRFAAQVHESSLNKPKILTLSAGTAHLPQLLSSD